MNLKNLTRIVGLIIVGMLCVSCSHMPSWMHRPQVVDANASDDATASGAYAEGDFDDQDMTAYKLKAPHDQVYYFDLNADKVHTNDRDSIVAQANYLVAHPSAKIRLEGNCDERGSREYNVALGWRRARAVERYLKTHGISAKQIVTISYGQQKPVAFCHDESCWSLNRRVNLAYEAK